MSAITTHVLDTALGRPARGVPIWLEIKEEGGSWRELGRGATDGDGRLRTLLPDGAPLLAGIYRITFDTAAYLGGAGFYPEVPVVFEVCDPSQHYHVPLLLSPFGFATYRGS
ncbi:MAG: hydroxyisourate hydrolase [Myxococcales bacterium]|nr:hydroxyisourate hydrolase [Myxococcales bacterium]